MSKIDTYANPALEVIAGNMARWAHADNRREGWHGLHQLARYGMSFRSDRVMRVEKRMELSLGGRGDVQALTALPWFSAMVVLRGQHVLYEKYAPDFGPNRPHSIQSISKTVLNLVVGKLVKEGILGLERKISYYIPEMGSGYASATLQQVMNMDVVNDYTEDFSDPRASYWDHEESMGWRLPKDARHEVTQREFLCGISSADTNNRTGHAQYKDANSAVARWVVERASGKPFRSFLADLVDAAGLENALYVTTDREGTPTVEGGICLTARDLARYFSLFVRRGVSVDGQSIYSSEFLDQTLTAGVPMPPPYVGIRYSNHLMVSDQIVGHGGWGGQYALANLKTGTVGIFLSVIENQHAINRDYLPPVIGMLQEVVASDNTW